MSFSDVPDGDHGSELSQHLKNAISQQQQAMGTNPFRALIYTMSPTYRQNINPNGGYHLGRFPRKIKYTMFHMLHT